MMSSLISFLLKFFLHRTRLLLNLFILLLGFFHMVLAQTERVQNRPYADYKFFHWGFHVGLHTQDLVIDNTGHLFPDAPEGVSLMYASVPSYLPGFSVGVLMDYSPILNWNFRVTPTLHFGENKVAFSDVSNSRLETYSIRRNLVELPFLIKYSSVRFNNTRPYVIAGPYASFQIGQSLNSLLFFRPMDAGLAVGVGCDIYLPYFKLSPELRLSYGFANVLKQNRPEFADDNRRFYSQLISRMQSRMILLTFNFE